MGSKRLIVALLVFLGGALFNPLKINADSGNQGYFSMLPDVPLMPGMDEVEDQSFVFDKAEGKVVGAAGFLAGATPEKEAEKMDVFYHDVLRQLGWKPLKSGGFERGAETLLMKIEPSGEGVLVRFQLAPLSR